MSGPVVNQPNQNSHHNAECDQHGRCADMVFCVACATVICTVCAANDHGEHPVISIEEAYENAVKESQKLLDEIHATIHEIDQKVNNLVGEATPEEALKLTILLNFRYMLCDTNSEILEAREANNLSQLMMRNNQAVVGLRQFKNIEEE